MKNLLIISPHFPPVNAADMHRVRQSLPYFRELGWEPVVVVVDPAYVEQGQDPLLLDTVPEDVEVIRVKAFSTKYTRKLGLGSLALRSIWFYYREVSRLLKKREFDLVYFSTTMFPLPVLGRIWNRKFGIPYVIDMQDPWHTEYYLNKSKEERPPKYWFVYPLGKYSERFAMKKVNGIIAVSDAYTKTLQSRYPNISSDLCMTLTFGAFAIDFEVLTSQNFVNEFFSKNDDNLNILYIGRGGYDMKRAVRLVFKALKIGLEHEFSSFSKVKMFFIGTNYGSGKDGIKYFEQVAASEGVDKYVYEQTQRIPYFQTLFLLKQADLLFIPGSDSDEYTASKIFPYILSERKIMAIFNKKSSVVRIFEEVCDAKVWSFGKTEKQDQVIISEINNFLKSAISMKNAHQKIDDDKFEKYSALTMAIAQANFFNQIISKHDRS
jgi:hypothetical protein